MIAAVAVLGVAYLVLFILLVVLVSGIRSQHAAWAAERAQLVRAVIARNPADLVGLEAAISRRPAPEKRKRDEDLPPPGTQPVGLDGGSF